MALQVLIAAVDRTTKIYLPGLGAGGQLAYARSTGAIGTLAFRVYGLSGAADYRPGLGDTIVVKDGGVTKFDGIVSDVSDDDFNDIGGGTFCQCTAQDNNRIPAQTLYTKTYAASSTLKSILQDLVANVFTSYSVTLDAAQDNGPTIAAMSFADAQGDAILNQLQTITGRPWEIDENLVLRQLALGTASGVSVGDAPAHNAVIGRVGYRQSRSAAYCNRVILTIGQNQQIDVFDTFAGDGVSTAWQLRYPPVNIMTLYGYIIENSVFTPIGPTTAYTYDPVTGVLTRTSALGAGLLLGVRYQVQFPVTLPAVEDAGEIASNGVYAKRFEAQDVYDIEQGTDIAAGLLNRTIATPKTLTLTHRSGVARIGQSIAVNFAARNLNTTAIVIANGWSDDEDGTLVYTQTVVTGSTLTQDWVDSVGGTPPSATTGSVSAEILPALTGAFPGDILANVDTDDEVSLRASATGLFTSQVYGPGVWLGRHPSKQTWGIVANILHVAGAVGRRAVSFLYARSATAAPTCAMELTTDDLNTANAFFLTPPPGVTLKLGSPSGSLSFPNLIEALYVNAGVFEKNRTTAAGYWVDFTPSLGATAGTWTGVTVNAARAMLHGDSLFLDFELDTGNVSANPAELLMTLPFGLTAQGVTRIPSLQVINAGAAAATGVARVVAGDTAVRFQSTVAGGGWTLTAGNNTTVRGKFWCKVA